MAEYDPTTDRNNEDYWTAEQITAKKQLQDALAAVASVGLSEDQVDSIVGMHRYWENKKG